MYVCQWHLETPYGKQGGALAVMRARGAEKFADALAPLIVPGSQRWVVYRVLDERAG
jgi:hypothetical protein